MAKPKRYPHPASRNLSRYGSDWFWWYSDGDGPVEVLIGGTWVAGEAGTDPNGVTPAWRVLLAGPDAGSVPGAHALAVGANKIPARDVDSPITTAKETVITVV